ncbi:MAG: hypothetical protein BroJett040_10920 [Oligoflexia bacterium]|nr:MAG: hypothetical protein BroJett040_10920 [Oligoflexia bacterium]
MLKFLTVFFGFILAAQSSFAEKVRLLADDREALQARVDILQQAKSEIIAEYFSVWNDDQSIGGMALLIDAAQRGVKVKVIIDAISNMIPRAVFAALRQKGMDIYGNQNLEVKVYNPIGINLLRATHRDHAKMIIVDGHTIISGGRNVGDKYFGLSKDRNFHDLDIIMSGPAVQDARQNFLKAWNSKIVSDVYLYEFEEENLDPWKCRTLMIGYSVMSVVWQR